MAKSSSERVTPAFATKVIKDDFWDFGNQVLYELCSRHPRHTSDDEITAKLWLIGRAYAAAIERRRGPGKWSGDDFYRHEVARRVRRSGIDTWFESICGLPRPDPALVLPVHAKLTKLFFSISNLDKRSLASKYAHFHAPRAVYIFDTRADRAIRLVTERPRWRDGAKTRCDGPYAQFFLRCEAFRAQLEDTLSRPVLPRDMDKVLLAVASRAGRRGR